MSNYSTADSRLASFFVARGHQLLGTETRYLGDDDRVYLQFDMPEEELTLLKREFFEGALCSAVELTNSMKMIMHTIREARELARESR